MNIPFHIKLRDRMVRTGNVSFFYMDYIDQATPRRWRDGLRGQLLYPHARAVEINDIINARAELFDLDDSYGNGNRVRRRLLVMLDQGRLHYRTIMQAQDHDLLPHLSLEYLINAPA
ncbi:MAG: hypothetical protein R3C14_40515 [Caldilineaceae bacterium]